MPPERRALGLLRLSGTAVLAIFVASLVVNPTHPVGESTPGFSNPIAAFELASRPEHVFGVLGAPGAPERVDAVRHVRLGILIDFLFLIAYPTFTVAIAMLLVARGATVPLAIIMGCAVVMALGDALENRELLGLTNTLDGTAMMPGLARLRVFTLAKWYALYAAAGMLAVPVWRESGWWRWSGPLFGLAALCGLVSLVHLPGIEWGISPLGLAWAMAYVRAFRRQSA